VEGDGSIRVLPVKSDPIEAFQGSGTGGSVARLLAERAPLERGREHRMGRRWLLDTSALLALRDDEAGALQVAELLQLAAARKAECLACFMTRMEVLHHVWKDEGEARARLADELMRNMPLQWVEASGPLLETAAEIKALNPLSVADAWIAAAAVHNAATLVHKDPEYRALTSLAQEWLG
jgi:predicted nucleic acid-binding protein